MPDFGDGTKIPRWKTLEEMVKEHGQWVFHAEQRERDAIREVERDEELNDAPRDGGARSLVFL